MEQKEKLFFVPVFVALGRVTLTEGR